MKVKSGTDACPHCGGINGFATTITLRGSRIYSWNGEDIDTDSLILISEIKPTCTDCGKYVRSVVACI